MARSNRKRYAYLSLIVLIVSCIQPNTNSESLAYYSIQGNTQGTTYKIIFKDSILDLKEEVDAVLHQFDLALSTYIDQSIITSFNNYGIGEFNYQIADSSNYFKTCWHLSDKIFRLTNGAFDPSIYPLIEAWGFFKDIDNIPDSTEVNRILKLTGFGKDNHYNFSDTSIYKNNKDFKVVFNAIAQGQAVDVLCDLLDEKSIENYYIEIGGELKVKGLNPEGKLWSIGIDRPLENSNSINRELLEIILLDNKAIATSGSYRQFYEKDGQKYSHTIDPSTGSPVRHQLLSVSVVTNSCAEADAFATAFMVMGTNKTIEFLANNNHLGLEVLLIYNNQKRLDTFMTKGFKSLIKE